MSGGMMTVQDPETSQDDNLKNESVLIVFTGRTEWGGKEHGVGLAVAGGEAGEEVLIPGGVGDGGQHVHL